MNWLNNSDGFYDERKVSNGRHSLFEEKRFNKVINIHKMTKATNTDKNILGDENIYLPTTYSYYIYGERKIMISRVTKVLPEYFNAFESLTRN